MTLFAHNSTLPVLQAAVSNCFWQDSSSKGQGGEEKPTLISALGKGLVESLSIPWNKLNLILLGDCDQACRIRIPTDWVPVSIVAARLDSETVKHPNED